MSALEEGLMPSIKTDSITPIPDDVAAVVETPLMLTCPVDTQEQTWQRLPNETSLVYSYFRAFCNLGPTRTINRLAGKLHRSYSYFLTLSQALGWVKRAEAYDLYWIQREDEAKKIAQDAEARKWIQRREQQRDREWELSSKLADKAQAMLDWPLFLQTFERDETELGPEGVIIKQIITQRPADWTITDLCRILIVSNKFGRLSTGLDTDRKAKKIDFAQLSDEELERIANEP